MIVDRTFLYMDTLDMDMSMAIIALISMHFRRMKKMNENKIKKGKINL